MKNICKRTICIAVSVLTLLCGLPFAVSAEGSDLTTAQAYKIGNWESDSITEESNGNAYKFTLSSSGELSIDFTGYMEWVYIRIFDSNGATMYDVNPYWNDGLKTIKHTASLYLNSGKYYFSVIKDGYCTGEYEFKLKLKSSNESFKESLNHTNNSMLEADTISVNKSYKGVITKNDDSDNYVLKMPATGTLQVKFTSYMEWVYISIYDRNGQEVFSKNPRYDEFTKCSKTYENITIKKGTYYVVISKDGNICGNYSLYTKFVVNRPGTPKATISKGTAKLRWAKAAGASGYEVQICKDKSFKSGVVKTKLAGGSKTKLSKKLSRKTKYYVRVRAYKKVGSKTYYSVWKIKAIKTK